jgi:hypothetical protein
MVGRVLKGVAEVLPAEALDLSNLTAHQVIELYPEAAAEIDGHEPRGGSDSISTDPLRSPWTRLALLRRSTPCGLR